MRLLLTIRLLFALLLLAPPAFADDAVPAPGLAGTWALDAEASGSVDPLLAALGRSKMERTMAKRIKGVTHTIALHDGWVEVTNANAFRTQTSRIELGKTNAIDIMGQAMEVTAEAKNGRVVTSGALTLDSGPATMKTTRGLADKTTMELVITLTPDDGEPIVVRRVFRKQPGS